MRFGAAIGILTAALGSAQAEVVATETMRYYDVAGQTADELRASMTQNSTGRGFDAYTEWLISWRYNMQPVDGGCELRDVVVTFAVTIDFPQLTGEDDMDDDLIETWESFAEALETHERNHAANGLHAAQAIDKALTGFSIDSGCGSMNDLAAAEAQPFLDEANAADLDYDRDTDHGASEGARFP